MSYQSQPQGFRTFLIVWLTQSVSVFGSALTLFVVTIWLAQTMYPQPEQQGQLALAISALSLAQSLPVILAAPLAGVWVDRHDRKRTMIVVDFAKGVLSLGLMLLLFTNSLQLGILLVIILISSTLGAFHYAAFDTSYAMIVPAKDLPRANGMMQAMLDLSRIIAPAAAAMLITVPDLARSGTIGGALGDALARVSNGAVLAIGVDAVTFFLASATLLFVFIPSPKPSDPAPAGNGLAQGIWTDIKVGVDFVLARRSLVWLWLSFTIANLLGSPLFLFQPLLVKFNLAADWQGLGYTMPQALALMNVLASAGGVAGGALISVWGGLKRRRVYGVLVPMVIAAACEIVFGLSTMLYLSAIMIFIIGVTVTVMNPHSKSIWQSQTPPEMQGRVFSVLRVASQFTWPLGTALAGWIGGLFNPGLVLAVMGVVFLVFSLWQLSNKVLLAVEQ